MDKVAKIKKYWEIVNKSKNTKKNHKLVITDNMTYEITENGYE